MSLIVVDVESDGPIPSEYSIVCFGAVVVDNNLNKTFYGEIKPVSDKWKPDFLAISGISREQHLTFDEPFFVMDLFAKWFDWQFINYYFHKYLGSNPFGYSSRRIGDIYAGMYDDMTAEWKHLRKTKHDHNPVNYVIGNAQALLEMKKFGLKF